MSDSNYLSATLRSLCARKLETSEEINQLRIELALLVNVAAGLETKKLELEQQLEEAKLELANHS